MGQIWNLKNRDQLAIFINFEGQFVIFDIYKG